MKEKKKISLSFNSNELYEIVEMLQWALGDYPDKDTIEYKEMVRIAQKIEKAHSKINGEVWKKEISWFE